MIKWTAEFQPRLLCSFGDSDGGPDGSDGGGVPSGDTGGQFSGDTGGDFSGDTGGFTGSFDAAGDPTSSTQSNADFFGDTTGSQFAGDTTGGNFQGDATGGNFSGDTAGGGFQGQQGGGSFPGDQGGGSGFFGGDTSGGSFFGDATGGTPTAGAGYQGWGESGWGTPANAGLNAAIGPPGWATGDYGIYGTGGPSETGVGPGAGPSVGGPNAYASAPGITGFPGDFGAPPGGVFGMPMAQGDVGPQAGPGMPGGPGNVGNAESGFMPAGPEQAAPEAPTTVPTDQRGENFFGPPGQETASSFFGPSQAQAAGMTDRGATDLQNAANAFQDVSDIAGRVAQSNPELAQALEAWAANQQVGMGQLGPGMPGLTAGPSPGAQQGFTGMSPAQAAAGGPFSGQPSLSGVSPFTNDQAQGKGDLQGGPAYQMGNAGITGEVNAAQNAQQQANQQQSAMFDAQALGEQGRGRGETEATPQQTISEAFNALNAANQQQAMQQVSPFDEQALGEQGRSGRAADTFDSRFGTLPPAEQAQPDTFDSRFAFQGPDPVSPAGRVSDAFNTLSAHGPPGGTPGFEEEAAQQPDTFDSRFGFPTAEAETPNVLETISRANPEITTGLIGPLTQGLGREAAPLGLTSMLSAAGRPGGSPFGSPSQASGRSSAFGPTSGRTSDSRPSGQLSISVSPNQFAGGRPAAAGRGDPGYYNTGGRGIAPGAKGAEYGGIYGAGVATGRPGTNTFGVDSRSGAYGFYDPVTGLYYR